MGSEATGLAVSGHKVGCVLESVSFLVVNVALAGNSGVTCLGVGHAEQVVGTDTAGVTVVAGNRVVNNLTALFGVDSEELCHGSFLGLSGASSLGAHIGCLHLLCGGIVLNINAPEFGDVFRVNRSSVAVLSTFNTNGLSSGLVLCLGVVEHGRTGGGGELFTNGEVDSAAEVVSGGRVTSLSICFTVEVLTLDSGNIASVAWNSVFGLLVSTDLIGSLNSSLMAGVPGNLSLLWFKHLLF